MPPSKRPAPPHASLGRTLTRCCTLALVGGYAAAMLLFNAKYSLGVADYEPPRRRAVPLEYAAANGPVSEVGRFPAAAPHTAPPFQPAAAALTAAAGEPAPAPAHPPAPLVRPALRGAQAAGLLPAAAAAAAAYQPPPAAAPAALAPPAAALAPEAAAPGLPPPRPALSASRLAPAPVPAIVAALLALAALPAEDLRRALDPDDAVHNYFGLPGLAKGECPAGPVAWLPARPPASAAAHFRGRDATKKADTGRQKFPAMVWYEHLSKAGGTSFCKLAKKNMPHAQIPDYYCMPSEPGLPDARVGQWPNAKLAAYFATDHKRLVSNEWEPFPLERLAWASSSASSPLELVLVTTVREPLNRLLSAYRFWGVLHNPSATKPPASRWLRNMEARAKADSASPRGMGKGKGTGQDFIARVGQPNFATWKFSGGTLPVFGAPFAAQPAAAWREPFAQAVRTLAAFDLAVPTELLSAHPEPLGDLLGWRDFSETHVVPSGKVVNNDARQGELSAAEYAALEDANRLDLILYAWVKATYLARIHCEH